MIRWADWEALATRIAGFVEWAELAPTRPNKERYAIVREGAIAWARVSPNPEVPIRLSGGRFYDTGDPKDHPEGAIEWCRGAAKLEKARIDALVNGEGRAG